MFKIWALCALLQSQPIGDTVTVDATIASYRHEDDDDIHVILRDSACTLVSELIPCSEARKAFYGPKRSLKGMKWKGKRVRVTGIVRWDADHGWLELHPVLSIARK